MVRNFYGAIAVRDSGPATDPTATRTLTMAPSTTANSF
jgi:hypothetical protein